MKKKQGNYYIEMELGLCRAPIGMHSAMDTTWNRFRGLGLSVSRLLREGEGLRGGVEGFGYRGNRELNGKKKTGFRVGGGWRRK